MIASLTLTKPRLLILIIIMTRILYISYQSKLSSASLWTKLQTPINRESALAIHHLHIMEPQPLAVALLGLKYLAPSRAKSVHQRVTAAGALNQTGSPR